MRWNTIVAVLVLSAVPVALAACGSDSQGNLGGSAVEEPKIPVQPPNSPVEPVVPGKSQPGAPAPVVPGQSATSVDHLADFLTVQSAGQRLDLADLVTACGASTTCVEELARLQEYLRSTVCPTEAACVDPVGMILYNTRTQQQILNQTYSAKYPRAAAVNEVLTAALTSVAGGANVVGGTPDFKAILEAAAASLTASPDADVDLKGITDMIVDQNPADGQAAADAFTQALPTVTPDDVTVTEAIDTLTKGGSIPGNLAADVILVVVGDSAPGGEVKPGGEQPVATTSVATMLTEVATGLRAKAGTMVTWTEVTTDIGEGAAKATEDFATSTPNLVGAATFTQLIDGDALDAAAVADVLEEIARAMGN